MNIPKMPLLEWKVSASFDDGSHMVTFPAINKGILLLKKPEMADIESLIGLAIAARDAQVQAALAEQEPVGYINHGIESHTRGKTVFHEKPTKNLERRWWTEDIPVYTHPAPTTPAAQEPVAVHASDCSTNNRGVPELLGPCDCSHQTRSAFEDFANRRYAPKGYQPERDGDGYKADSWQLAWEAWSEASREMDDMRRAYELLLKESARLRVTHPAPTNPAAQERAEPVAPAVGERETIERYAQAAHWYINASDNELREQCDTREAAVRRVHAIEAELLAQGFEFLSATPPAPAQPAEVPEGWHVLHVESKSFDNFITAMDRAERKGYLPDAVVNEWLQFDYNTPAPPTQPSPEPSKPEQAEAPSERRERLQAACAEVFATLPPASAAGEREALRRIKYEAVSLADAQVIALEALSATPPAQTVQDKKGGG